MVIPVQITFRDLDPRETIDAQINDRAKPLEKFAKHITGLHVTALHHISHKGRLYQFTLELLMPGEKVVVKQGDPPDHAYGDVYVAMQVSFVVLERWSHGHLDERNL